MASQTNAADSAKAVWIWWEKLSHETVRQNADEERLVNHLNQRWTQLPNIYKNAACPILQALQAAVFKQNSMRVALASMPPPPLEQWKNFSIHQLASFVDGYWSVADRIPRLEERLQVLGEVAGHLAKMTKLRGTFETCMSHESRIMLGIAADDLEGEGKGVQAEIEHLKEFLPQYVEHEEAVRRWKREQGFPEGTGWVGSWFLGKGSFGEVSLWLRQDHNGHIVNRVVIKQAEIGRFMLNEDAAWVLDEGVYVPTEIYAPQLMSNRQGSETILQVRGWREIRGHNFFRVLLDYCPFGDLYNLRCVDYDPNDYDGKFNPKLPEPFLWYVFECLATAGVLMEQGRIGRPSLTWRQIFHSDIKLGNIMLSTPNPEKYPWYPSPVLADFGFAQLWEQGTRAPPSRGGTPTCESPENAGYCYRKDGTHTHETALRGEPLNRKSDVWSVGNIVWGLMAIHEGDHRMNFRGGNDEPRDAPIGELEGHYSESLLALVADCMEYYPEDRIDFSECLRRILMYTGEHPDRKYDHVHGLRTAREDDADWDMPGVRLMVNADKFPMYTKLAHAPNAYPAFPANPLIPDPPHEARKLEQDGRYKGPVSADTRGLSEAGSERRHAAGGHTRREHMWWLADRHQARQVGDVPTHAKVGYYVPDSDDDSSENAWGPLDYGDDDGVPAKKAQQSHRVPDSGPGGQQQLGKRPVAQKSRSAEAGADRRKSRKRDERSRSPPCDPRKRAKSRVTMATKTGAARDPRRRPAPKEDGPPPVVRKQRMPGGFSDYKYGQ